MANTRFQLKRSLIAGVVPTTSDIATAELAINVVDRKLFTSNGSSVFELGANLINSSITGNATIQAIIANNSLGSAGEVLHSNGTSIYWATDDQGVTSVSTGNGLSGGPITTTGTVSVLANNGITANSTGLFVTQGTGTVVNATGVHVNSTYIGTLAANSATYLGSVNNLGNASGIYTTGTINAASLTVGTSTIANSTGIYSGVVNGSSLTVGTSVTANSTRLVIGTAVGLQANDGIGTSGQVLTSNATTVYWSTPTTGTVTSVSTGSGLSGGPISTTGTVSVLANSGITANSTGVFVTQGTGTVVNATGVHVNSTYIGTLSANSATYLGSSINLGNASGIYTTGTINAASLTVGTSTIANSTGVYTGIVNGSTLSVGSSITANSTRLVIGTAVGLQANGGIGSAGEVLHSNGTSIYWATDDQGVTSVSTGNGLTGGPISTTGTVSVLANNGITANSTGLFVTQGTGTVVNATGVHVNSSYIGTLSSNNSTYLNGQLASFYTNASNITTGTLPWAQAPIDSVNTSGSFTFFNNISYNANLTIAATSKLIITAGAGVYANGILGSAGQVLHSNGTSIYWAADDQGVTSVSTGSGLSGGPISTTGTISVLANSGITANSTGLFVTSGTGTVVNATGVHVNSSYIGTLAANSATYLGSSINLGNATGIYTTGTINAASLTVGTSTIANSTGLYTGVVNGSTLSVGSSVTANSTRLVIGTAVGLQANGGIGTSGQILTSNGTTVYWATASGGATLTANNTDTQTFFIPMANTTSGSWSNGVVANTKLYFVPSTGTLNATIFNSLSDRDQKINIVTAPVGIVDVIRGVEYDWKDTGKKSSGVIAQEIEEYLPHLVDTKDGSKSVNYAGLIAYLIEEIKQLKDRVKILENE